MLFMFPINSSYARKSKKIQSVRMSSNKMFYVLELRKSFDKYQEEHDKPFKLLERTDNLLKIEPKTEQLWD